MEVYRALTFVAVIANHLAPGLMLGGFFGVDVFFVIPSYVISKVISGNLDKKNFLSDFHVKRFARINPLFIFEMAVGTISLVSNRLIQTPSKRLLNSQRSGKVILHWLYATAGTYIV